ncbi:MAG: hypothetical protein ACU84J_03970 [Gammaproteobacteria bacterium]
MGISKLNHGKERFIGLRWKSFVLLSLLLLSMCSAFYALNYHALIDQFTTRTGILIGVAA